LKCRFITVLKEDLERHCPCKVGWKSDNCEDSRLGKNVGLIVLPYLGWGGVCPETGGGIKIGGRSSQVGKKFARKGEGKDRDRQWGSKIGLGLNHVGEKAAR
jgi:hypothetical protein